MKKLTPLLAAGALFALLAASPASAQDGLAGTWVLTAEGPRGAQTMTVLLDQDGSALTGTVTMTMGRRGGGGQARELVIEEGSVEGGAFVFSVTMNMRGNSITQTFTGTFDGDVMEGSIETPRGSRAFTGERGT